MSILLSPFTTPYESAPFEEIRQEDFLPVIKELIANSEHEIELITSNTESPSFTNTIEALAFSGKQLDRVTEIFFNLLSAETNEYLQSVAQEISPLLSAFSSRISQNKALFERIQYVYSQRHSLTLSTEQQTLLEDTYDGFVRSGALLSDEEKASLEQINMELASKTLQFGKNVLAATNSYFKHITDASLLKGIPSTIMEQYHQEALRRGLDGYVITLQYPSFAPLLTYAENRDLRAEIALASGRKAFDGGEFDNQELIRDIVNLRQQKSRLLGYSNFASLVLSKRMAQSEEQVHEFLDKLLTLATPFAHKELQEIATLAKQDGIDTPQGYDHAFYAEKLRKARFDIDDEELKPFFSLERTQQAIFQLAKRLFNLEFRATSKIQKYHPEVHTFEVWQNNTFKALLYVDYFPREGKRAGAWMTSYRSQYIQEGINHRPHVSVVCNLSRPTPTTPSLLTFQEVTTLFHEFGHAIHGILANTHYPSLSGTSVKWDFVELPSQFLENYCYEPEFLQSFAKHYQTDEPLGIDKITKLANSRSFMEGYQTLRQVGLAKLDLAYHGSKTVLPHRAPDDIKAFEKEATKGSSLYPHNPHTAISTSFSHIFEGGYAAGYYSYKWAEVLEADAFEVFKQHGIFNPDTAQKYQTLLEKGGTEDPSKLYQAFKGSSPDIQSLINRAFSDNSPQ